MVVPRFLVSFSADIGIFPNFVNIQLDTGDAVLTLRFSVEFYQNAVSFIAELLFASGFWREEGFLDNSFSQNILREVFALAFS